METPYAVIAIVQKGPLLLAVSRKNNPEDLGFPGGKVEPGEDPEAAIRRELLEETGLSSNLVHKVYEALSVHSKLPTWAYLIVPGPPYKPRALEAGTWVGWVNATRMLDPRNSFAPYYEGLFKALGIKYTARPSR